jgi:hypothetical protein
MRNAKGPVRKARARAAPAEPAAPALVRRAWFSPCGRYRYRLTRTWGRGGTLAFILLNPSTADASRDDPTLRRCIGLARRWGYGSIEVVNLFAWRATHPEDLRKAAAPVGPGNGRALRRALRRAEAVVVAWGNQGAWRNAGPRLLGRLLRDSREREIACVGWTRLGHPRHVLYVRRDAQRRWIAASRSI